MCGVSPENYSQMELSHDDELVDNNQNQNLKLVKHTLRNQVCELLMFSSIRGKLNFYEIHNSY